VTGVDRTSKLPFRTWAPYWLAGALNAMLAHTSRDLWPGSLAVVVLVAAGVVPVVLIWAAHYIERHYRKAGLP